MLNERQHIGWARLKFLLAGEGQQALRQGSPPTRAFHGTCQQSVLPGIVADAFGEKVEITDDRGEQIVEIMRDAPNELPYGLDLLSLQKSYLCEFTLLAFGAKTIIRFLQCSGALRDQVFELLCHMQLSFEIGARFVLTRTAAFRRQDRRLQRNGLHRPLKKGDVAEFADKVRAELRKPRTFVMIVRRQII
jgi:hypothetical protein